MNQLIIDGVKYKKKEFDLSAEQYAKEFGMTVAEVEDATEESMLLTPGVIEINGEYYEEIERGEIFNGIRVLEK